MALLTCHDYYGITRAVQLIVWHLDPLLGNDRETNN
jgi:hypothetical protein